MNEFVFFQRFEFFAEGEIGIREKSRGDDIAGIELQCFVERFDGGAVIFQIALHATEAHPGGEIGRVMREAGAKNLLRFNELPDLSKFFGERIKDAVLRIRLEAESKLFDLRCRRGLGHLSSSRDSC